MDLCAGLRIQDRRYGGLALMPDCTNTITSVEFPTSTCRNTELFGLENLKAYRNGKPQPYLRILALFIVRLWRGERSNSTTF